MNDRDWIDYLYGEMSDAETSRFEQQLESDPVAKEQLESFRKMRFLMHQHEDVQPSGKPLVILKRSGNWMKWMAVAASLLVLLVAGSLLGVNASVGDGVVQISLGKRSIQEQPAAVTLLAKLEEQNASWQEEVQALRADLQLAVQEFQMGKSQQPPTTQYANYQYVESALHDLHGQNQQMTDQLVDNLRREQNENTEALVNDLLRYWDEQRKADLQLVNDGLQNLAESIQLSSDAYAQLIQQPIENY